MTRARDISNVITDANLGGTLDVSGAFTSQGIDDNADATAMTISSDEDVMIGTTDESSGAKFIVGSTSDDKRAFIQGSNQFRLGLKNGSNNHVWLGSGGADNFRVSNSSGSTLFELNSSGNIVLPTSSAGIHLGVTSATASNLLDDYEEGTFTPNFIGSGDNYGATHTFRFGQYTKIGDTVYFTLRCASSSVNSNGDQVYISGLPFTASYGNSGISDAFAVVGNGMKIDFGVGFVYANLIHNENVVTLLMQGYNVGSGAGIDNFRQHDMYASHDVRISGFYKTT